MQVSLFRIERLTADITIARLDGAITKLSSMTMGILGMSEEELVGMKIQDIMPGIFHKTGRPEDVLDPPPMGGIK